jgi:hypothetical protein
LTQFFWNAFSILLGTHRHFEGASSGSGAVLTFGDEPLMFHTGLRKMSPVNRDALSRIMPAEHLGWVRCC